jgi:hypothetical protein
MARGYKRLVVSVVEISDFVVTSGEGTDVIDVQEWWGGAN